MSLQSLGACTSLRTQYPSVAGHHFVIGLAGFTAGFEAPEANDPSKIVGIDPDLFTYLGQCLGFTYDLQNSTYSALIPALESGRVAMGPSLYVTTSRLKEVNFVSSFSVIDGSVVAKGNPKQITSTDSLCGLRVVAPAGTYEANTLVPSVSATCKQEGKKAVTLVLADQAVAAMQAGRGDIYLTALSDAESIAKQTSSLQTGFSISLPILNGFPMAKSDTTLANAILGGMKVIQAQGLEQPLLTKWGFGAQSQRPAALNT